MNKTVFILLVVAVLCFSPLPLIRIFSMSPGENQLPTEVVKGVLNDAVKHDTWPERIDHKGKKYKINYSLDNELTNFVQEKIKTYRPDYISVVIIDNNNGAILTAIDYDRKTQRFGKHLTFSSSHPAASIFKIITSAELLENSNVDITTPFEYTGRTTTLYKRQLSENTPKKWTRVETLREAFARSNNVVFGKAAIEKQLFNGLYTMAQKFGFEESLMTEVDMGKSIVKVDERDKNDPKFELAEVASGFNKNTLISPVHAALLASVMVNDGQLKYPHIVENITQEDSKQISWTPPGLSKEVLKPITTAKIKEMMEDTVIKGTARSSFRKAPKNLMNKLAIGGKTGTLTGGDPYGKRDWFVSYAYPKDNPKDKGISVCVMIINVHKWYTKSAIVARDIMSHYYRDSISRPRYLVKNNIEESSRRVSKKKM